MPRPKGKQSTRPRRGKRRYIPKRKRCFFCGAGTGALDYKSADQLRRFISDRGRILPGRKTGVCVKHQRALGVALKRGRHLALLPYAPDHLHRGGAERAA